MRTRTNPRPDHQEGSRTTRVMAHLRDSLVSQLKNVDPSLSLHARHSSLIEHRLRDLFPAFITPTHPPYALMIRSAILGLEDEAGSTEEAISEFIKKEYSDLPWAHDRILGLQLEKLCEIGEIARVSGWRYVLKAEDEVKEQCEGSEKKKRGKRRSNKRGEAESAEEECKKGRVLELGKQSQQHQEVEPQRGFVESKNQDCSLQMDTTCSSPPPKELECGQLSVPDGTVSTEIKLPPTQMQHEVSSDIDLGRLSRRKASSTLVNVHDELQHYTEESSKGTQDEDTMSWDFEQRPPKRLRGRPRKLQTVANCPVVSLLPSDDGNLHEHKPNINEMKKQDQYGGGGGSRGLGRFGQGRGRGRPPTLSRKANQCDEQCDEQLQHGQSTHRNRGRGRGRGRGRRGRPPKLNENPIPYEKQDDQRQHKERHVRARGRGWLPKPNQHTNVCEDQLQSQADNQSHELASEEAKSPDELRQESEPKYGSGEVSRSKGEEKDNPWRLMPVQRKVQGIDGCWPLSQSQK